jgi:hypothetical protein
MAYQQLADTPQYQPQQANGAMSFIGDIGQQQEQLQQHQASLDNARRNIWVAQQNAATERLQPQSASIDSRVGDDPTRYTSALANAIASGAPTFEWNGTTYNTPSL